MTPAQLEVAVDRVHLVAFVWLVLLLLTLPAAITVVALGGRPALLVVDGVSILVTAACNLALGRMSR